MAQYHRNIVAVLAVAVLAAMVAFAVDQKITELTEETSPATTDLLYIVIDPATSPVSRKAQIDTILAVPHGVGALDIGVDGGGSALVAGWYWPTPAVAPANMYLVGPWQLTAGDTAAVESGTANIQLYRATYAAWPTGASTLCLDVTLPASSVATGLLSAAGETVVSSGDRYFVRVVSATVKGLALHIPAIRR